MDSSRAHLGAIDAVEYGVCPPDFKQPRVSPASHGSGPGSLIRIRIVAVATNATRSHSSPNNRSKLPAEPCERSGVAMAAAVIVHCNTLRYPRETRRLFHLYQLFERVYQVHMAKPWRLHFLKLTRSSNSNRVKLSQGEGDVHPVIALLGCNAQIDR